MKRLLAHLATADIALIKLAQSLPARIPPVPLDGETETVAVGDTLVVAGYGVTVRGDGRTGGTVRAAPLTVTGQARDPANPAIRPRHQRPRTRPRRLRRRFRGAGISPNQWQPGDHRRRQLVDRAELDRRLRRPDRHHAASALPRLDRRHRATARLAADAVNWGRPPPASTPLLGSFRRGLAARRRGEDGGAQRPLLHNDKCGDADREKAGRHGKDKAESADKLLGRSAHRGTDIADDAAPRCGRPRARPA